MHNKELDSIKFNYQKKYMKIYKEINDLIEEDIEMNDFWIRILKNSDFFKINSNDLEILKYLKFINIEYFDNFISQVNY